MTAVLPELPDDVEALKAMALAMAAQLARLEERSHHLEAVNKAADERIAALTAIVKMLERARYGRRSERLAPCWTTTSMPSCSTRSRRA